MKGSDTLGKMALTAAAVGALWMGSAAYADDDAPDDVVEERPGAPLGPELEREIVVVARAVESDSASATQRLITFGAEDIERRQSTHVSDVLQEAPGVYVVPDGPRGQFTRIFMRGAASNQSLVLVDGVPQNDATTGGGFDFNDLSAAAIERIEVLSGSYGVLYGSEAIGGVVSVETRRGRGEPRRFALVEGGSFDTHREAAGFDGLVEDFDFAFTVENLRTHGERDNEDFQQVSWIGRFGYQVNERLRVESSLRYVDSDVESPYDFATSGPLPLDPNIHRYRETFSGSLTAMLEANDWLDLRLTGSVLDVDSRFHNRADGRTTIDPDFTPGTGDESSVVQDELISHADETDLRGRFQATADVSSALGWTPVDQGGFGLGVTGGAEYVDQDTDARSTFPDFNAPTSSTTKLNEDAQTRSFFALASLRLPDTGPLTGAVIEAGLRDDDHSDFGSQDSGYVGARVEIPSLHTTLRGSWGEGFRAPKPSELYDLFVGNTDLDAETSESWDIGGSVDLLDGDLELGVTFFDLETKDLIAFVATDTTPLRPFGRLVNIAEAETRGWEYAARAHLGSGFTARGSMTVQNPRDTRTGAVLPNRAKHFGSVGVAWEDARWALSIDAFISGRLSSAQRGTVTYPEPDEREDVGKREVVTFTARYRVNEGVTLFGRVENLLDDDYVTTPSAPAGPPLGVYVGIQFDF